jgi:hypothetical protein
VRTKKRFLWCNLVSGSAFFRCVVLLPLTASLPSAHPQPLVIGADRAQKSFQFACFSFDFLSPSFYTSSAFD